MQLTKTKYFLFFFFVGFLNQIFGQLQADVEICKFNSPKKPYIEVYLNIYAQSINYDFSVLSSPTCKVELTEIIKKKNSDEVVDFKKLVLSNSDVNDSSVNDLMSQERFSLEEGVYELELELDDLLDSLPPIKYKEEIELVFNPEFTSISDIELLDSYWKSDSVSTLSKSGFNMLPLVNGFYPTHFHRIAFYSEIYNSQLIDDPEGKFVVRQFIENYETGQIAGNFNKTKKYSAQEVIPLLTSFNIESLPSGNYYVVVQIRDRNNELILEKKKMFQRVNVLVDINTTYLKDVDTKGTFIDRINKDSIDEFIYCLRPIASISENNIVDNQLSEMSDTLKLQFFYSFWNNIDHVNPERSWQEYKTQVVRVNKLFSTPVKQGYETDRGRIYLKYGAPNRLTDRPNETNSYPYQIWQYYHIGKFNNIKFVFYMPDLVTNEYWMLHSDLRGEIQNYKWQKDLQMRNSPNGNIDQESPSSSWGNNAGIYYSNP